MASKDGMKKLDDAIEAVKRLTREKGFPPTLRELGDELGCSSTMASFRLKKLEEMGLLVRARGRSRAITLKDQP